ncbi:DNA repair RAD51-like protein [Raphidocelis subcapitata]|uniref:DNA repair protein RAD51 homolog 3 n=1 Tax=Raphidocelis subcapitata TaxID=307507 RepID=A0A2V0NQ42_9CHLO|nr:DNA repair RAD51-like protein [Raphidocelis subcapitata]|eukprot:GBF87643.1 DNA repair RAD51-like protein [Raphidocelis subcapitata]
MPSAPRTPLVALALAPRVRQQLLTAGYATAGDLVHLSPEALAAAAAGLSTADAAEALSFALGAPQPGWRLSGAQSARELLQSEASRRRITTLCPELDVLLGGGVATGAVTEFCGVPGVGKTQLGMQLSVDVQIPPALGGLGGKAVYIDTEGSFMPDRVLDIAAAAARRVGEAAACSNDPQLTAQAESFTLQSVLEGVLYFRAQDSTQQLALMRTLAALLESQPQARACGAGGRAAGCNRLLGVRLVVVDSVTFHFRQDWKDPGLRARLLAGMAQDAAELAEARGVAVVFINQVTTKVLDDSSGGGVLVPALGESWGQASSTRVALFWEGPQRLAHLLKASAVPPGAAAQPQQGAAGRRRRGAAGPRVAAVPFDVTPEGVRSAGSAAGGGAGGGGGGPAGAGAPPRMWQQQQQQHPHG